MPDKNKLFILLTGAGSLFIYFIPYFILGTGSSIRVFDNLDGEVLYKIFTARNGYWLDYNAVIPEIMNGLPRFCITSGLNFTTFIFALFPPFIAYLVNDFTLRLIGFIGIYLLLSQHIIKSKEKINIIALLISCSYIFIPFFTIYGLTDLGQPLLLFAFLNILKEENTKLDYFLVCLFPFFSSFILSGLFVGIALGLFLIIFCIIKKKFFIRPFLVLVGYAICSLLVEYNMIISVFQNFHSHREETIFGKPDESFILFALKQLWETYIHSGQFYTLPIWIITVAAIIWNKGSERRICRILFYFAIVFFFVMLFYYYCPSIKGLRLSRFYHLLPICWMMLLAVMSQILWQKKKVLRMLVYTVLCCQIFFLLIRSYNYSSGNKMRDALGFPASYNYPSYASFYAEDMFKKIADFIGEEKSEYRILTIGILPAVAQYNGYYTLDSYQNNYPLEYKHQFRRIIAVELEKSEYVRNISDYFGNWCYVFPSEVSPVEIIEGKYAKNQVLYNLELNAEAMRNLQCKYVFSSAKIENNERNELYFLNLFKDENSHWDVWLYEIR
ncbi:hypothetical protein Barb4_00536 [Bacteroidales bacterium Barb4]|nr:hypothetical protein Barb4_00536 [Bacteroidales bacterium Barb4]